MKDFSQLFSRLETSESLEKVAALEKYFAGADERNKLWTIALLSNQRPRRVVTTATLQRWAREYAQLPVWLFEESHRVVGDIAETIALILPSPSEIRDFPLSYWIEIVLNLGEKEEAKQKEAIFNAWSEMSKEDRFLLNKLLTGGLRLGVSQKVLVNALARHTGLDDNLIAHRLMREWSPVEHTFQDLLLDGEGDASRSRPYPFFLASPLEIEPHLLGEIADWQVERLWDGIRAQLIVRQGELFVWSNSEELLTHKFPEFNTLLGTLPDGTVLDGEILAFRDSLPLPLQDLQTRIGRKNVTRKSMQEIPVIFIAFDLLESQGKDIRSRPLVERRELLEKIAPAGSVLHLSERVEAGSWAEVRENRDKAREYASKGLVIRRRSAPYRSGRKRGDWWEYKVAPLTIDAVLLYVQRGEGQEAGSFVEFTFAVWGDEGLVPIAKTEVDLTEPEKNELTAWAKNNTLERFGPVRSLKPEHVFEIAFESIAPSTRHKSGITLRNPRIVRWRREKKAEEADTLERLKAFLVFN
ncbi:MAG: ATP-dependent DNA ligase [Lewinellaceae bacterium]|nr:ATP-dependent DNA ligase [Lewinellaceae bacterium]